MARYKKDGKALPSVTEVIRACTSQPWMGPWATKEMLNALTATPAPMPFEDARWAYKKVGEEAAGYGTDLHDRVEKFFNKEKLPVKAPPIEVHNAYEAFLKWNDKYKPTPIATEMKVYGNGWAGTLDFLGWIDDELWVLDWKTSKKHQVLENGPQIAAYRSAVPKNELNERAIWNCGVVRFDKYTAEYDFKDYSDKYYHYLRQWDLMLNLFMLRHPRICKKSGWKGE